MSFLKATTVFLDENAVIYDDNHSKAEERFLLLGMSDRANLCIA